MEYQYSKAKELVRSIPPEEAYMLAAALEYVGNYNSNYYPTNDIRYTGACDLIKKYGFIPEMVDMKFVRKRNRRKVRVV